MPQQWLHFVGKSFYGSPAAFAAEAAQYGVSRRISLQQAKQVRYGDIVILCQWDKTRSGARVFGSFVVNRLYGSGLAGLLDEEEGEDTWREDAGGVVVRACGSFTVVCTMTTTVDIPELLLRVTPTTPVGDLMIGGRFAPCEPYLLKDIPHRQGFRRMNAVELEQARRAGMARAKRCPVVRGQFYVWADEIDRLTASERETVDGLIYEVEHYAKREPRPEAGER